MAWFGMGLGDLRRRALRDDWQGVQAGAARKRSRTPAVEHLAGVAELVVGHVATARVHLEAVVAAGQDPAAQRGPVRAAARQLVSVDALAGSLDAARARLDVLVIDGELDAAYAAMQRALVELQSGRPDAARAALEADPVPVSSLTRARGMRSALAADAAAHAALLARARRRLGDLDGAHSALAGAIPGEDRPYLRAELLLEEGWLAHERGLGPEAELRATESLRRFQQVGAAIDAGRARLLLAVVRADPSQLDLAEAAFSERGAFGLLPDVEVLRAPPERP